MAEQELTTQTVDILVVDDTIASLRVLTEIISNAGYKPRPVEDPQLALEAAQVKPPSLILLDIRMPKISGFEVCRRLKQDERTREVPVIFISALQDVEDKVQGFKVGGVDFITKPFQEEEVLARVQTHIELRNMQLNLEKMVVERTSEVLEREERFRATFEQAAVGVAHVRPEGKFLRLNRKFCDIVGYTQEEMLDLTFQEITHPDDLDAYLEYVRQVLEGQIKNFSMDKRYYRKNGSIVWVTLTVALVLDYKGNPKYFVSVVKDISERKEAEKKLVNSESKYRGLVDNSIIGVFTTTTDGRFKFANDAMVRMFDFDTPEEMIEKGSLDRWKDLKERERMLAELQQHGKVTNFEAETITHTDRKIHVLFSARLIGNDIIGMVMDINERKEAEKEIEQLQMQLKAESAYLQEEIKLEHNFENIVGQSETLKYVLHRVEMVAPQDSTVILLGETGTGKELIARALHQLSPRNKRPLVKVNCATLPAGLIESELFGHEKGAFTGAATSQVGRFELANKSTLFLDEIGEMPLELQAKLLHVLESGEFERLGSPRTIHSDARIIAATNRDLEAEVRKRRFRKDLWYRLKIFPITIPPLRNRIEDIPFLVDHFVQLFSRKMGKEASALKISNASMQALQAYPWPGNVRELIHVIESALITSKKNKLHFDLPKTASGAARKLKTFEEMEREYILEVLKVTNWKIKGKDSASAILGLHPNTLHSRIKKLGLKRP